MEVPTFRFNFWLDTYPEYNCSALGIVDWRSRGESHPYFGAFCILYGTVMLPPYVACALALLSMRNMSVCKIMMYLAIADIADMILNTFAFGTMLITGEVFCTHPRFQVLYSIGVEFFFFCSSFGCLLLALNRFGKLLYIRSISWFFQAVLFTPPLLFNSKHHFMLFDPMIYNGRFVYVNYLHFLCVTLMPVTSLMIYMSMLVGLYFKYGNIAKSSTAISRASFQIIVQSGIIISIHLTTCFTYQILQYVPANAVDTMMFFAHFGWMLVHSTPPIVYLAVMRGKILHCLKRWCCSQSTKVMVVVITTEPA